MQLPAFPVINNIPMEKAIRQLVILLEIHYLETLFSKQNARENAICI
jgi:hypothetical protein